MTKTTAQKIAALTALTYAFLPPIGEATITGPSNGNNGNYKPAPRTQKQIKARAKSKRAKAARKKQRK